MGQLSFHASPLSARRKSESAKGKAKKEKQLGGGPTAARSHPCQVAAGNASLSLLGCFGP